MSETEQMRHSLLAKISRGLLYSAPLMVVVVAAGCAPATIDQAQRDAAATTHAAAEGEAAAEAEAEAEGEAEGEAEAEAEAEASQAN